MMAFEPKWHPVWGKQKSTLSGGKEAFLQQFISSSELADIFGVSERQIERLVAGGVLEQIGTGKAYRFALETVVPQYAAFLMSGISLRDWAPDT